MGDDYSNHQMFAGGQDPDEFRQSFIRHLKECLSLSGFEERIAQEATRAIAVGPSEKWLCVYDSSGNGDDANPAQFTALSLQLSRFAPVVDIHMDDSCAVHFHLYENGQESDRFGNIKNVINRWDSEEERLSFRGKTDLWRRFLCDQDSEKTLRRTWDEECATTILSQTAQLLGWNETLCESGFTIDYDGIPVLYYDHFSNEFDAANAFNEWYFA